MITKNEIKRLLIKLGITPDVNAYQYLADAIEIAYNNKFAKASKDIYPDVGDFYNVSAASVERCMRTAIISSYFKNEKNIIAEMVGYTKQDEPLDNSKFIFMCAEYFHLNEK